jgi:hypothetical protein
MSRSFVICLILKPGEFLHIPKGCSHAFRKACKKVDDIQEKDCHFQLRKQYKDEIEKEDNDEGLCVSIAFDWLFSGYTKEGIRREALWSWMRCQQNRRNTGVDLCVEKRGKPTKIINSLAQTELALLFMASTLGSSCSCDEEELMHLKALDPLIQSMIKRQLLIITYAEEKAEAQKEVGMAKTKKKKNKSKTEIASILTLIGFITVEENVPDTKQSPIAPGCIDPCSTDFRCKHCGIELANCCFHCNVSQPVCKELCFPVTFLTFLLCFILPPSGMRDQSHC